MPQDILVDNKYIYDIQYIGLETFSYISKIVFVLFIFGFFADKPAFFLHISFIIKIIVSLFLIYRFNSYRKYKITFTELDRKAIFSIATYILIFSFLDVIQFYIEKIKIIINPFTSSITNKIVAL